MNFFAGENDGAGPGLTVNINQPEHLPLSANWFGQAEPSERTVYYMCFGRAAFATHFIDYSSCKSSATLQMFF